MPGGQSPDNGREWDENCGQHPLAFYFGLPVAPWKDERQAPPIEREALRALWRKELHNADERRAIWDNVLRFRSWAQAMCEIMVEEYRQSRSDRQE